MNRLASVTEGGWCRDYDYDRYGNRVKKTYTIAGTATTPGGYAEKSGRAANGAPSVIVAMQEYNFVTGHQPSNTDALAHGFGHLFRGDHNIDKSGFVGGVKNAIGEVAVDLFLRPGAEKNRPPVTINYWGGSAVG